MVGFTPFVGSYVKQEFVRRVPAPALDSMSGAQRTAYLDSHPESYTLATRSRGDGGPEEDASPDRLIELSAEALDRILAADAFVDLESEAFFLYRLRQDDHVQLGIVGLVETAAYLDGRVKRHEQVGLDHAIHLSTHFERLGVHSSPIALGYRADPVIRERLDSILERSEPVLDFTSGDGLEQAVWVVDGADDCAAITSAFCMHDLYIADGHHRAAAAGELSKRVGSRGDFMLGVVFSDDRLNIDPFHRRVTVDENKDMVAIELQLINLLGLQPEPELESTLPTDPGELGVYMAGQWWYGNLPPVQSESPLDQIDPVRLQKQVIGPVLGIDPEASASQIGYFLGDDRRSQAALAGDRTILFVLRSVSPAEVFAVADAGLDMPPKSTYVTPKPRSGVFLRKF